MEDYEIRDVMNRNRYPKIDLSFVVTISTENINTIAGQPTVLGDVFRLDIQAVNVGVMYAKYVHAFVTLPSKFARKRHNRELGSDGSPELQITHNEQEIPMFEFNRSNTVKDSIRSSVVNSTSQTRYEPILPKLSMLLKSEYLDSDFEKNDINDFIIQWETYADNAPPNHGKVFGKDIRIIDEREK